MTSLLAKFRFSLGNSFGIGVGITCLFAPGFVFAQPKPAMTTTQPSVPAWMATVISRTGKNRPQIITAWNQTPPEQREGMRFLLENMPDSDLQSLSATYLQEQVALGYQALAGAPWKGRIPKAVFLNDILPYAILNEERDASRKMLREKSLPLIADCRTPGEAAMRLNERLFPLFKVRYSTERKRPDQNPTETIESGKATCSGLSILLVDACRAVGIPARVAGTPLWANMRGNHTWVEIWDGEKWRFTGAAEPDPNGLDRGWFTGDAAQARKDAPQNAIYASSFKRTGLSFPLVWATDIRWVAAENVTDRYTAKTAVLDDGKTRLLIKTLDSTGKRVPAKVELREAGKSSIAFSGESKGETADLNDMLSFRILRVCPPQKYDITVTRGRKTIQQTIAAGMHPEEVIVVRSDGSVAIETPLALVLADRFGADEVRKSIAQSELKDRLFESSLRTSVWEAYKSSVVHDALRKDWEAKMVSTSDRTSPYLWRTVGEKPASGWALVIAMHGGGGAPKAVNDGEWKYMFEKYYRDHPEAGGYVYLALRAPNDAWNGFYDDAISPLIERLIQQFVLFQGVDPDKVYTLGASHGGYGAFVIGPKIPYRFAAIHAAASAPTDGETRGENLRNAPFTIMTGALDKDYGRIDRDRKFMAQVEDWRKEYGGYDITLTAPEGVGHLVPDHDVLADMLKRPRNAFPKHVVWTQTDTILKRFYWLEAPNPVEEGHIEAKILDNTITIKARKQERIAFWLDTDLVDVKKPVTVIVNGGKKQVFTLKPDLETYCEGLEKTADVRLATPYRIEIDLHP